MNPFETALDDIFSNADFTSVATINDENLTVIRSSVTEEERLTMYGLDDGVGFYILVKKADVSTAPKRDQIISVGGTEYRVSSVTIDSADLTYRLDLKSKSSR